MNEGTKQKVEIRHVDTQLPVPLANEAIGKIKSMGLTINVVLRAALEDFLAWDGKPRWIMNKELIIHGKKRYIRK